MPRGAAMEDADSIHAFWFGDADDDGKVIARQSALWWKKQPEVDAEIGRRFTALVGQAACGALDHWLASPRGRLALILLTDQFPRNTWRGTAAAFAFDTQARRWALEIIRSGADAAYRPVERVFLYLPLEHAEDRADQAEAVRLFTALAGNVPAALRHYFDDYLDYARRHQAIIERFGRFPHRNAALGRSTTAEEATFLTQPGSGF
jgi:uncharacterized protein (DUF924 family)